MNSTDIQTFTSATTLAQNGFKNEAHLIMLKLYEKYPKEVNLLLWLAFTSTNLEFAKQKIEMASIIEPNNPSLINAKHWLAQEEKKINLPPTSFQNKNTEPSKEDKSQADKKSPMGEQPITSTTNIIKVMTPEEEEVEQKKAELAALESELVQRELELTTLKADLELFSGHFWRIVGVKYAELDQIEVQIADLEAAKLPFDKAAQEKAAEAKARARESQQAANAAQKVKPTENSFEPVESLKRLYRQLAKLIHPDLALDEKEKVRRTLLMTEVNAAYAAKDENLLRRLLQNWMNSPESVEGNSIGADLVRLVRKIAQVRQRISQLKEEVSKLKQNDLFEIKTAVVEAEIEGRDLLTEMAREIELEISQAMQRLSNLREDK